MAKILMLFLAGLAVIQIIKPLGWPGLRYRRDAWKLALFGLAVLVVTISLRPD
ncbi:hypothetical protein HW532_14510 [Kaustia mangrovi]|uniref:Uncharacterized protein n=1 Tax=Kaustia mangrovi TaxID=2593653 RepID=A0A7S8C5X1_9HYPH|nr:hypothetical protein [Kaustia mangrovi]QPC43789.1 hypothetical protein HW532_14510 [Kaustia mangrovi]